MVYLFCLKYCIFEIKLNVIMNLELLTKQVANICRAMGGFLKSEIKNVKQADIESKGVNDFVTYVDKKTEDKLVSELKKILPEAGFIVEENSNLERKSEYNWVIDPLDGTTNYIHGLPIYSISVALIKGEEVVSGVIFEAEVQECFYAWQQGGSFLNGHKIHISKTKNLKDSLLATGFPYREFDKLE